MTSGDPVTQARAADLPAILTSYGVKLNKTGKAYLACCIFHDDSNPSMSVYEQGVWRCHCHSCGANEDSIGVIQQLDGCDFKTAVNRLTANGFERKDDRIITEKPVTAAKWKHTKPPAGSKPDFLMRHKNDDGKWYKFEPQHIWTYKTLEAEPLGYVARYHVWIVVAKKDGEKTQYPCNDDYFYTQEAADEIAKGIDGALFDGFTIQSELKKVYWPWTYGSMSANIKPKWESKQFSYPRPLYGMEKLAEMPDSQILLVEGEKACDAAQELYPMLCCMTWPGGSNSVKLADWRVLKGRENVVLWPDNDPAGERAMLDVGRYLFGVDNERSE